MTQTTELTILQQKLQYAFEWMARATKASQEGDFASATHAMIYAMQNWAECQHEKDRYITQETDEQIDWKFFSNRAMAMAKKELENEGE